MKNLLYKYDLHDLFDEYVYVNKSDTTKEIRANHVSITFLEEDAKVCTSYQLEEIIERIIIAKRKYILENKLSDIIFYLWYDAQSLCLHYCIISDDGKRSLPFGCRINVVQNKVGIVKKFLDDCIAGPINVSDIEVIYEELLDEPYILDVYVLSL